MKKMIYASCFVLCGLAWRAFGAETGERMPRGWYGSTNSPKDYAMHMVDGDCSIGATCPKLSSQTASAEAYASIQQSFSAERYRGKRVRFSGLLRTANVTGRAGLILRIEGPDLDWKNPRAVDTMADRPIRGTTEWTKAQLVLDVALDATRITVGGGLNGVGSAWFDGLEFEVVDASVPTTEHKLPLEPQNLRFEK
jgi:hypothetical protein